MTTIGITAIVCATIVTLAAINRGSKKDHAMSVLQNKRLEVEIQRMELQQELGIPDLDDSACSDGRKVA